MGPLGDAVLIRGACCGTGDTVCGILSWHLVLIQAAVLSCDIGTAGVGCGSTILDCRVGVAVVPWGNSGVRIAGVTWNRETADWNKSTVDIKPPLGGTELGRSVRGSVAVVAYRK